MDPYPFVHCQLLCVHTGIYKDTGYHYFFNGSQRHEDTMMHLTFVAATTATNNLRWTQLDTDAPSFVSAGVNAALNPLNTPRVIDL